MIREEAGGGKKLKAKGGAAAALSAAPAYAGIIPDNWKDQWDKGDIAGQDGSSKTWNKDSDVPNKGAVEAGLSPGEELDNPDWLDKASDRELTALNNNLTPKQKIEVLSCQRLFCNCWSPTILMIPLPRAGKMREYVCKIYSNGAA
ncbi:hypothetical protein DSO57_1001938 [Entomophthora muscae]|uniref:Uncharacterized protein n=1 Tax=Entomophthora muscae TaxID=34485 RepID=A0ACC2UUX3_9FUNG|nr:hypothetical protein DSO57_1001938 [Entomophthora muscae]